jgi:predicted nucleotidyltransferase
MTSIVDKLHSQGLIKPPKFLVGGTQYEVIMGSFAYGVSSDTSDVDVYGFGIPPKEIVFPHTAGMIFEFDQNFPKFGQYQQHHIKDPAGTKEYDLNIYNVVKYFRLCANGNPNMIDSLFVPPNSIIHMTNIGTQLRENRHIFLSKKCWHTFKGYAYQQLNKIKKRTNSSNPKRAATIEKYGFDTKFGYNLVRLLNEVEQILTEGDIDLQRNREQLKDIRNGAWTLKQLEDYFVKKESELETLYTNSKAVPHSIREEEIKQLLVNILEEYYGNLEKCVTIVNKDTVKLNKIREILME